MRIPAYLYLLVIVLTGCGTSGGDSTEIATPTETPAPTERPTPANRLTPRPTESPSSLLGVELHGPRSAALDTAAGLGWDCGQESVLEDGNPAVLCTYPGGTANEGWLSSGRPTTC